MYLLRIGPETTWKMMCHANKRFALFYVLWRRETMPNMSIIPWIRSFIQFFFSVSISFALAAVFHFVVDFSVSIFFPFVSSISFKFGDYVLSLAFGSKRRLFRLFFFRSIECDFRPVLATWSIPKMEKYRNEYTQRVCVCIWYWYRLNFAVELWKTT